MSKTYQTRAARSSTQALAAAIAVVLIAGCGDDGGGKATPDAGQQPGLDGAVPSDGSTPLDAGTDSKVTPVDSAVADTGRPDAGPVDAGRGTAPVLTSATAKQVGRAGTDLRVDVTGTDPDKDITNVSVELFDAAGTRVGTERVVPVVAAITAVSGTSYVILDGFLEGQTTLGKAKVTVVDGRAVRSETIEVAVSAQPVLAENAACDAAFVDNRCGVGLGCKGTTAKKCSAGEPPTLVDVGYFQDELGGRVVMRGTDPDGDVSRFTINFFKGDGTPALVDLDGDGDMPPVATFSKPASAGDSVDFSLRFTPADNFFTDVAQVKVTVSDARATNNTSNEKSATRMAAPTKSSGQPCDPQQGFDYCKGTVSAPLVCATTTSGATTASKCTATATARKNASDSAQVLSPGTGKTSVTGKITASLWDPAAGCTTGQINQADSAVKLLLATDAAKVTLSTDFPYTSFDTVLYALTTHTSDPVVFDPRVQSSTDFWCIDDQPEVAGQPKNNRAILELKNLTAGTYLIVIDSVPNVDATGDLFQLNVTVE